MLFHSSSVYFLISLFVLGKLYLSHHLRTALSETPNFFAIEVKDSVLIIAFKSPLLIGNGFYFISTPPSIQIDFERGGDTFGINSSSEEFNSFNTFSIS